MPSAHRAPRDALTAEAITVRAATPADIPGMVAIHSRHRARLGAVPRPEVEEAFLRRVGDRGGWIYIAELDGSPAGRLCAVEGEGRVSFWGVVDPDARGRGVGTALLDTLDERASGRTTRTRDLMPSDAVALLESRGYRARMVRLRLVHPAPGSLTFADVPAGVEIETGLEGKALKDAVRTAFAGAYGDDPDYDEDTRDWVADNADPDLAWIARSGRDVVGFALGSVGEVHEGRREGLVEELGCRSDHRGKGLGRALLTRCVARLVVAGATDVLLYVDPASAGAIRLYEASGFSTQDAGLREYVREPGPDTGHVNA